MNEQKHPIYSLFPTSKISSLEYQNNPYFLIDLQKEKNVSVLMTNGLFDFEMKTPEKKKNKRFIELCFCIPSYWDINDLRTDSYNWVFLWLYKLKTYIEKGDSWIGDGHTIYCGKDSDSFSKSMKQNHLFICNPLLLEEEFSPLKEKEKEIHYLFLIPIFCDEMDYKQGKGTLLFKRKLFKKGISEKLDDFRQSALRNRWRFFK